MKRTLSLILAVMMIVTAMVVIPVSASATTVSTSGWDGAAVTPLGTGTAEDPFIIESAGNLRWMANNVKRGDEVKDNHADVIAGLYGPSFDGQYFKQVRDIDLNGKDLPSIGYYYANAKRMGAFGGTYDGQGYKIYNGNITVQNNGHGWKTNWGNGLFGMVYGGTIKNVVMDDVTVYGYGMTGAIVGRATAPADNTDAAYNVIENCVVGSGVTFVVGLPNGTTVLDPNFTDDTAGRAGGIAGMVYGTTIKNCVVAAQISVSQAYSLVGGVVGTAGFNSLIDSCKFTGGITMDNRTISNTKSESAYGGIVGFISPFAAGAIDTALVGPTQILNCYNSGSFTYLGTGKPAMATYWGGILGGLKTLQDIASTESVPYPYLMENCYNTYALTSAVSLNGVTDVRFCIGGLLGYAWCSAGANTGTLWIKDSASVTVDARQHEGTNEYRHQTNKSKYGYYPVEPVKVNGASTVTTKSADELAPLTAAIDTAISTALKAGAHTEVTEIYMQRNVTDNTMARFTALIKGCDWAGAGFEVTVTLGDTTYMTKDITVTNYFTTLNAYGVGEDEGLTADEGYYYISFIVENMPTDTDVTIMLTPYVVDDTTTYFGATVSNTFEAVADAE